MKKYGLLLVIVLIFPLVLFAQDGATERGQAAFDEGEYEAALDAFTAALEENPQDVDALIGRSRTYIQIGEAEDALDDAARAVELAPDLPDAYVVRGLAVLATGDGESALEDFETATALDPDYATSYFYQGQIYFFLGEADRALANYDRAIELEPENDEYVFNRAQLYNALGEPDNALADYTTAIKLKPDNANYYYSRSFLHFSMGNLDLAIDDSSSAIEADDQFASAYLNRGYFSLQLEDYASASVDYLRWIDLNETERVELDLVEEEMRIEVDMDFGYIYEIPLKANITSLLNVRAFSPGGLVDPVVVILDAEGNPIMVDDDGGRGTAVLLEDYPLPYAGDFTIILSHAGGGSTGEVVITIDTAPNVGNA